MWPFRNPNQKFDETLALLERLENGVVVESESVVVYESQTGFGMCDLDCFYGVTGSTVLYENGKTGRSDVNWKPISEWKQAELIQAGFLKEAALMSEEMVLAMAVINGDMDAARPLVDELLAKWKE